jgi:hypothetical protein
MALTLATLNTVLATESNRLGPTIARKTLNTSVWQKLIKQEAWPDEMGEVISMLTYQRSLPNAKLNWKQIRATAIGSEAQHPAAQTVEFKQSLRQYGLQHTAVESPQFDVTGMRFSFKRKEQLNNIYAILEDAVRYSWDERKRDEYIRLAERKIVVAPGLPESSVVPAAVGSDEAGYTTNASAFVQVQPTSELTQSVLSKVRQNLLRTGARNNPLGMENGAPVFGLICSSETSERLITQNSETRNDLRYAEPSELVKPLGVERSFKGFYHLIDDSMPRYTFSSGAFTEVPYWIKVNGTWVYNSAYENADYEASIIFQQDVYSMLMPAPQTAPGGNTKFDPQNFRGDFKFLNVPNVDPTSAYYNPDGTLGFFRGVLASGSKPGRPEYGVVFIHQRSTKYIELIDVSAGFGTSTAELADDTATALNIAGVDRTSASWTFNGTTTNTSTTVTVASTLNLAVGQNVYGTGIPAAATIASITNATTFVLSAAATATGTVALVFTAGAKELGE